MKIDFIKKILIIILLVFYGSIFLSGSFAQAIEKPNPQILDKLGIDFSPPTPNSEGKMESMWIGNTINAIYEYLIGIVGILATVVMMIGGVIWITAGGNASRIGEAKAWIGGALMGLVLALASYTILYQINDETVKIKPIIYTQINPTPITKNCKATEKTGRSILCEDYLGEGWGLEVDTTKCEGYTSHDLCCCKGNKIQFSY